jgi:hypothetical protein
MSAGIAITSQVCWLKAGWLAEYVAAELRSNCGTEVAARLDVIGQWSGAVADFTSASPKEIVELYQAALKLRNKIETVGPSILHDPSFLPGVRNAVEELVGYLSTDPRTSLDG